MSSTKKVALPVPQKKRTPRKKVIDSSEFEPLIEKKKGVVKPAAKRTRKIVRPTSAKKVPTQDLTTPKAVLSEADRLLLEPRRTQMKRTLVALPRLSLSERSVTIMSVMSRSVGVCIACIGIGYSLFSSNILVSAVSQTAQVNSFSSSTLQNLNCNDPLNYEILTCAAMVDKKPAPKISIDGDASNLSGSVPVRVNAPFARQVRMQLIQADSGAVYAPWQSMYKVGDSLFEQRLDAETLEPGLYKVRVYVSNFYGGYDAISQDAYAVRADTTVDASPTTDVLIPVSAPLIKGVSADRYEATDTFSFSLTVEGAAKVELVAIDSETKEIYTIGVAKEVSKNTWTLDWKLGSLPNTEYNIRVRAFMDDVMTESNTLKVRKVASLSPTTAVKATTTTELIPTNEKVLKPPVTISVLAPSPVKGLAGISVDVAHASSVSLALLPKNSLRSSPLGRAVRTSPTNWIYRIDTSMYPDGEYTLIVEVRNQYGEYEAVKSGIQFKNVRTVDLTADEQAKVEVIKAATVEIERPVTETKPVTATSPTTQPLNQIDTTILSEEPSVRLTDDLKSELARELDKLSVALRVEDTEAVNQIEGRIESLKQEIVLESVNTAADVDTYVGQLLAETKKQVAEVNELFTERTKQNPAQDSDRDKISDFDEIRIYKTNPFVPDTDNDGFLDGVEVQSGYNPLDAKPEVLVSHESPKEAGIVRDDILIIKSITTAAVDETASTTEPVPAAAIIAGYALPNSFVTLYIFSTPIIVTIRTASDGSWNYRLDKELEDGEHEVYIGVTDNAGKIVAKSAPFGFIKQAEAFSGIVVDSPAQVATSDTGNLFSEYAVYLVLGISTVAIGVILMLLGLQLQARRPVTAPGLE